MNTFVNPDFIFHSQITDVDMLEPGLDCDDTPENLEKWFKNVLDSVRSYEPRNDEHKYKLTPTKHH